METLPSHPSDGVPVIKVQLVAPEAWIRRYTAEATAPIPDRATDAEVGCQPLESAKGGVETDGVKGAVGGEEIETSVHHIS